MRARLEAHRDELPDPEDIADHDRFRLRPDRPFPVGDCPSPTAWVWEDDDEVDEDLLERAHARWVPLRHFGGGEYDVLVLSGPDAGRVWTRTAASPEDARRVREPRRARPCAVNAHLPGAIVRNVDIAPGPKRRTYDARVHTFPVNRPRRVVTVERSAVSANALGALVTADL